MGYFLPCVVWMRTYDLRWLLVRWGRRLAAPVCHLLLAQLGHSPAAHMLHLLFLRPHLGSALHACTQLQAGAASVVPPQ